MRKSETQGGLRHVNIRSLRQGQWGHLRYEISDGEGCLRFHTTHFEVEETAPLLILSVKLPSLWRQVGDERKPLGKIGFSLKASI